MPFRGSRNADRGSGSEARTLLGDRSSGVGTLFGLDTGGSPDESIIKAGMTTFVTSGLRLDIEAESPSSEAFAISASKDACKASSCEFG